MKNQKTTLRAGKEKRQGLHVQVFHGDMLLFMERMRSGFCGFEGRFSYRIEPKLEGQSKFNFPNFPL